MATSVTRVEHMDLEEVDDGKLLKRVYKVLFAASGFTLWEARGASAGGNTIPADGQNAGDGTSRICTRRTARRAKESKTVAVVECEFSIPDFGGTGKPDGATGDSKWNISVEADGVAFVETINKTRQGKPICNVNFEPFDPMPEKLYHDERYTVSFTTGRVKRAQLRAMRGKVNSKAVTLTIDGEVDTFAKNTLRLDGARWSRVIGDDGSKNFRVTLEMTYRADGWARKIPNAGFYKLDNALEDYVPILDGTGRAVTVPKYLNEAGTDVLSEGADVILLSFDVDEEADFAPMLAGIGVT